MKPLKCSFLQIHVIADLQNCRFDFMSCFGGCEGKLIYHFLLASGVYAYVILKDGVDNDGLKDELKRMVKKAIGSHAVPEMIQV